MIRKVESMCRNCENKISDIKISAKIAHESYSKNDVEINVQC